MTGAQASIRAWRPVLRRALRAGLCAAFGLGAVSSVARSPVQADPGHGEPASLLVFPLVSVEPSGVDTLIRLTNLGDAEQTVRCSYVSGENPYPAVVFVFTLTPGQPIAWRASLGAGALPIDGVTHVGIEGSLNSGSIPPLGERFVGALRCAAAEPDGTPTASDVLLGDATIQSAAPNPDSASYGAIGLRATGTSADEPDVLVLGGPQGEYDACPDSVLLQPFLDGAVVELGAGPELQRETATTIVLVTCGSAPGFGAPATLDLELTTEAGQRFVKRRSMREHLVSDLSRLDVSVPSLSIFNSASAGSPSGNLRLTAISPGSGVLALALTSYVDRDRPAAAHRTAVQPQFAGTRSLPDLVDLSVPTPPVPCTGDCDGNGSVSISELILGVGIALGNTPLDACRAFDVDGNELVSISELVAAVSNALAGCAM